MVPGKKYNLRNVICIVGTFEISGYGEDGAVTAEPVSARMESKSSADGQIVYSAMNDDRVKVTITVLETSRSARDLFTLWRAQEAAAGLPAMPFLLIDPTANGDKLQSSQAVFMEIPAPTKGKTVSERVFVLELPYGMAPGSMALAPSIVL